MNYRLNLIREEKSPLSLKYKISKFPDGQQSIEIQSGHVSPTDRVDIITRLVTFLDVELLICSVGSLRESGIESIGLEISYLIGGRSDQLFTRGGVNYMKSVISPIINSLNLKRVSVFDPHSYVTDALIQNFNRIDNSNFVDRVISDLCKGNDIERDSICIVSPDAGAYKKLYSLSQKLGIKNLLSVSKYRDINGEIHIEVPQKIDNKLVYLIVDDICDGGRTFIEVAKKIYDLDEDVNLNLAVTHGIFSAGFEVLFDYFDGIWTTNSYKDFVDGVPKKLGVVKIY